MLEHMPPSWKIFSLCAIAFASPFTAFSSSDRPSADLNVLAFGGIALEAAFGVVAAILILPLAVAFAVLLAAYRRRGVDLRQTREQLLDAQELIQIISAASKKTNHERHAQPEQAPSSGIRDAGVTAFTGEVLLCEDNAMSRQVILDHLTRLGVRVAVAENGGECVKYVRRRISGREKPFDLILMDIHMPVMGGLEAASELSRLGCPSPVVAVTSNVTSEDISVYRAHGMSDCLGKPFKTHELCDCLRKYLTPRFDDAYSDSPFTADDAISDKLKADFVKDNQSILDDINRAVTTGDIVLAHRLAHTLKGVAGLVGKMTLAKAAGAVERALDGGKASVTAEQMNTLGRELNAALEEFSSAAMPSASKKPPAESLDAVQVLSVLDRIEPMLKAGDSDCLELAGSLRAVDGAQRLIDQIEDYDFELAYKTLVAVRASLESRASECGAELRKE